MDFDFFDVFRICISISPKISQSQVSPESFPGKAFGAFLIDPFNTIKAFCKPRIKVGTEWVTKGQTCEQATMAVGGIARAIFDRLFKWLIVKCNNTLIDPTLKVSQK